MIGAFGTVTKGLLKGMEDLEVVGRVETIQTAALLKTVRILRRVLETWGDLLSLKTLMRNNNNDNNNNNTDESPNLNQKNRPYNNQQKKENLQNYRLCCPGWPQNKTERMWKEG